MPECGLVFSRTKQAFVAVSGSAGVVFLNHPV